MQFPLFQRKFSSVGVALVVWFGLASCAHADDTSLEWSPRFTRFTTAQYLLTGAMAGGLLAKNAWLKPQSDPNWKGGVLFDDEAASLLGAHNERERRQASLVSDYLALGLMAYPFAVDSLLVAGVLHGNYDVAYQMGLISLQALLMAKLVSGLTKDLVGRARPDSGACQSGDELACGSSTQSFISGHTTGAFVGAGTICAHHQNLALYGDGVASAVACGASLAAATAVGTLRMVAGRHHFTDVFAGATVGLAAGYLLPNLINYDFGESRRERRELGASGGGHATLVPVAGSGTLGLLFMRSF